MSEVIFYTTDDEELDVAATVNQQLTVQKDGIRVPVCFHVFRLPAEASAQAGSKKV